jgi:hypothetical protein
MATMEKVFKCLSCGADIRLERKANNSGWNKFNLDGSEHVDEKKKSNTTGAQIAALAQEVKGLKETVNILISQVQGLRSELKK